MIRSWGDGATRRFFETGKSKWAGLEAGRALDALVLLRASPTLAPLAALRQLRLHKLSGDRRDQWAVLIGGPWRIVFRFKDGEFHDVQIVDYH
ncbi:MAG: type II toxin-antitoxin system RelE/ParE family toxin [Tagaea sp.]|nr:type II toxin-antitoxin system RelE/ParE family toxin [Tagaea sp.]